MNCFLCERSKSGVTHKCSSCSALVCSNVCPEWESHKLECIGADSFTHMRNSFIAVLNTGKITKGKVRKAIDILTKYYKCDHVGLEFQDGCTHVAKANNKRIHICSEAMSCAFQDDPSHAIPNYNSRYGINHFTVVLLHEFGHVLDKRGIFPKVSDSKYRGEEERATGFALDFLDKT